MSKSVSEQAQQAIEIYARIEELAEEILGEKQQVVSLDKRRNSNREALHGLPPKTPQKKKMYYCMGDTFVKLKPQFISQAIQQDQETLTTEINKLRQSMKDKTAELAEKENIHSAERLRTIKAFSTLKPVNS